MSVAASSAETLNAYGGLTTLRKRESVQGIRNPASAVHVAFTGVGGRHGQLLLTVPHNACPQDEPTEAHFCDSAAPALAKAISRQVSTLRVQTIMGTIPRTTSDLNRDESIGTEWRSRVSRAMVSAKIYLDVHSFPPESANYAPHDVVIFRKPGVYGPNKPLFDLVERLVDNGFDAVTIEPVPGENSLLEEFWESNPGIGMLIEFQELQGPSSVNLAGVVIAKWAEYWVSRSNGPPGSNLFDAYVFRSVEGPWVALFPDGSTRGFESEESASTTIMELGMKPRREGGH